MYETLYCDDVNIDQAIDYIDVEDMAQHIYFGPQAEIMEKLNNFNQRYHAGLSITKTFRWSPGTYNKVAELMMKKIGFKRRASGMYNYLSRENYWWESGRMGIQSDLREMDNLMYQLRGQRVTWLDDPAVLIERKELFKNFMCEKFDQFLDITSNTDKIQVLNVELQDNGSRTTQSLKLSINLVLSPGEIQIYNVRGSLDTEPTHIQNLPVDMDILMRIDMYPLQEMVRHTNYNRPNFNVNTYGRAEAHDDRGPLRFPYVSQTHRRWNQPDGWGTICYGDDSSDIDSALRRFELPAYSLLLMNWMNRYTQNTNPYNNIKKLYHGEPKWLNDDYRVIFGTNRWADCSYRPSGNEDYCDINECALRHTCEIYKAAYPEPVSPEQAEQLTLQWATRMGGVGSNASQPQGDREQDHIDTDGLAQELIDQEMDEERRINAEMDADEARQEGLMQGLQARDEAEQAADNTAEEIWESQRDLVETPEPNNSEEE